MLIQDAIETRRSVKHYDPDHKITDDQIEELFSAAILSPTSFNMQNWRFVVLKDADLRVQVEEASWGQKQVTEASITVLVCANLNAYEQAPERYWKNAPEKVSEMMTGMMVGFYKEKNQLKRDEAMRSGGIAAQTLMLKARDMGLDSCPMIGFDPVKVAEIIKLPEDHVITMMITIGKAKEPARERAGQLSLNEVVFVDGF